MIRRPPVWRVAGLLCVITWSGCGTEGPIQQRNALTNHQRHVDLSDPHQAEDVRLARANDDQVLDSMVITFDKEGLSLTDGWTVDMEERKEVSGSVNALKYLRVKGDVKIPDNAGNEVHKIGCVYVELKDNVYYREKTWLRIATDGVRGALYDEVVAPLQVKMGGWKDVPILDDSITLGEFGSNTIKAFDKALCFRINLKNAPAQDYKGQIIVQYLRPGPNDNPVSCDSRPDDPDCAPLEDEDVADQDPVPMAFACQSKPAVLKAGQSIDVSFGGGMAYHALELSLAADPSNYVGARGTVSSIDTGTIRYIAPAIVSQSVRILVTAHAIGTESLPAFCEVHLTADEDIGVGDDGEINGLIGNVYKLPVNQKKLPDFDTMDPVAKIVVGNLDIPTRSFDAGFPGVEGLYEWFGISFRGRITIPQDCACEFRLNSDDGANLYIDGQKVIDNDGVHAPRAKNGLANLSEGSHDIKVDYFQGPRYHIALQLLWKLPGANDFTPVPPEAFSRPLE